MGRESTVWESFQEITDQFASEMLCPPDPSHPSSESKSPAASGGKPAFQDLLQADSVEVALLQHKHLEIGCNYQNHKIGSALYKLLEVTKDGAKLLCQVYKAFLFSWGALLSLLSWWRFSCNSKAMPAQV